MNSHSNSDIKKLFTNRIPLLLNYSILNRIGQNTSLFLPIRVTIHEWI